MRVGIVGLGAAGIRAAQLLERAGVEVALFEARKRIGGRLWTCDLPDGTKYEAGGEWIDADHHRVIAWLDELGIEKDEPRQWPGQVWFDGDSSTEDKLWPTACEAESELSIATRAALALLESNPKAAATFERSNLAQFLDAFAEAPRERWWLEARIRSDEGDDTIRIGTLGWLRGQRMYVDREEDSMSSFRVKGGWSCALMRAVEGLRAKPRFEMELHELTQNEEGVQLGFYGHRETFDAVIVTVPPGALDNIVFDPSLKANQETAFAACGMARAMKVSLRFETAFWKDSGLTGRLIANLPFQQVWDGTMGNVPVLNAYICGQAAVDLLSSNDCDNCLIQALSQVWPEAKNNFVDACIHDWINDYYSLGAFSYLAPGFAMTHQPYIAKPHGCVHFAGEHTAEDWTGFIEGAFESAERAVKEILDA